MNGMFRQSMTWLHTWAGLVFCWALYFMFVTGSLGYFDTEIDQWMQPETRHQEDISMVAAVEMSQQHLASVGQGADNWYMYPVRSRDWPNLRTYWYSASGGPDGEPAYGDEVLDPSTGRPLENVRETGGGQELYRMHYNLHYFPGQVGYYIMAVVTMFMFVGLVTGVVAHKKIFIDFFTFRWAKGQRSWLDAHNLLSVTTLPFQFMITYSGLIFTLALLWVPFVALGGYGFNVERIVQLPEEVFGIAAVEKANVPAPIVDVAPIAEQVAAQWGGEDQIYIINFAYPGDANSTITFTRNTESNYEQSGMVFSGVTGEYLNDVPTTPGGIIGFVTTMLALHEGLFAAPVLRWLYFMAGILGTGMIATGAVYWVQKRKPKKVDQLTSRGYRFVERMNVATIAGLLIAIGAYFWANRLLPVGFEGRAEWEVHSMFLVWALCFVHAIVRPVSRAWIEQCWAVAAVFLALPIVNAITTDAHLGNTLVEGNWTFAGFDITAIAAGLIALFAARHLSKQKAFLDIADDSEALPVMAGGG